MPTLPLPLGLPRLITTPDHTRRAGLAVHSFRWWAVEDMEDQRSRLFGVDPFSGLGGRMSQPSRQCCR